MKQDLMLDVDQAGELKAAFRRWGWKNGDIKKFCESDCGPDLLKVLNGQSEIVHVKHVIPMDEPSKKAPEDWKVRPEDQLPNVVAGQWEFNAASIQLYLSEKQTTGKKWIGGLDLKKELEGQIVFNDNLLDFLEDHPELIPQEWRGKAVFGWGRIYRDAVDGLCVRCLFVDGDGSCSLIYDCVGSSFDFSDPAAVARK